MRRQARALLFEAVKNRRLVDSNLLRNFSGAAISCLPAVPLARFHLREVFNVQEHYKPRSFLSEQLSTTCFFGATFPPRAPRTCKSFGQINHLLPSTPTHRAPQAGVRCWNRPTRQRDRALDGGRHKRCSK